MFRHRVDSTRILPPRPSSTPFVRRSRRAWLSTRTRSCKISLFLILRQSYRTFAHRRKSLVLDVHQLIVPDTHQIHRSRRSLSLAVSELCCMHTESQSATPDRLRTAFHHGRRRPKSRRKGHLPYLLPDVGLDPCPVADPAAVRMFHYRQRADAAAHASVLSATMLVSWQFGFTVRTRGASSHHSCACWYRRPPPLLALQGASTRYMQHLSLGFCMPIPTADSCTHWYRRPAVTRTFVCQLQVSVHEGRVLLEALLPGFCMRISRPLIHCPCFSRGSHSRSHAS